MYLNIVNENNWDLDSFCEYLILEMRKYMKSEVKKEYRRLEKYNEFLQDNLNPINKKEGIMSVSNLLILSTYNLTYKKLPTSYIIEINPSINIPNSYAKFIDIVKLVNNGNLQLPAFPIYDDMMDYFADKIGYYYKQFEEGNG